MPVKTFATKVRTAREEQRLSRPDLAKLAGVSPNLLERLEGMDHPPKPKRPTVIDLSHALGLNIDAELAALGYPPLTNAERSRLPSRTDPWPELEQLWGRLTPAQKHAVVSLIGAFTEGRNPAPGREPVNVVRLSTTDGVPEDMNNH